MQGFLDPGQSRMIPQLPELTMDGNEELGSSHIDHQLEVITQTMTGGVNQRVAGIVDSSTLL